MGISHLCCYLTVEVFSLRIQKQFGETFHFYKFIIIFDFCIRSILISNGCSQNRTVIENLRGRFAPTRSVGSSVAWRPALACIPTTWLSPGTGNTGAEAPSSMNSGC